MVQGDPVTRFSAGKEWQTSQSMGVPESLSSLHEEPCLRYDWAQQRLSRVGRRNVKSRHGHEEVPQVPLQTRRAFFWLVKVARRHSIGYSWQFFRPTVAWSSDSDRRKSLPPGGLRASEYRKPIRSTVRQHETKGIKWALDSRVRFSL